MVILIEQIERRARAGELSWGLRLTDHELCAAFTGPISIFPARAAVIAVWYQRFVGRPLIVSEFPPTVGSFCCGETLVR